MKSKVMLGIVILLLVAVGLQATVSKSLRNGNIYYKQKNWDKAKGFYQEALQEEPTNFEALKKLADIEYSQERYAKAQVAYTTALDAYKKNLEALAKERDKNDYINDNREDYESATKFLSTCGSLILKQAITAHNDQDYQQVVSLLGNLQGLEDRQEALRCNILRKAYMGVADTANYIAISERYLKIEPNDANGLLSFGLFFCNNPKYADYPRATELIARGVAIKDTSKADNAEKAEAWSFLGFANSLMIEKDKTRIQASFDAFNRAHQLNPQNADFVANMQEVATRAYAGKDYPAASTMLEAVVAASPDNETAVSILAYSYYNQNNWTKALEFGEKWKNLNQASKDAADLITSCKNQMAPKRGGRQ